MRKNGHHLREARPTFPKSGGVFRDSKSDELWSPRKNILRKVKGRPYCHQPPEREIFQLEGSLKRSKLSGAGEDELHHLGREMSHDPGKVGYESVEERYHSNIGAPPREKKGYSYNGKLAG